MGGHELGKTVQSGGKQLTVVEMVMKQFVITFLEFLG
jgi:hypothetical protein